MSQMSSQRRGHRRRTAGPARPGLCPGAPPLHGRVQQLRHQLLDHLDPDRRGHPLRLRPQPGPAPRSAIGWPVVTFFILMIAATMAEVASAYPTAGGLYYWASRLRTRSGAGGRPGSTSVGQVRSWPASTTRPRSSSTPRSRSADRRSVHEQHPDLGVRNRAPTFLDRRPWRPARRRGRPQRRRHPDRRLPERPVGLVAHRLRGGHHAALFPLGTQSTTEDAGFLFAIQPQDTRGVGITPSRPEATTPGCHSRTGLRSLPDLHRVPVSLLQAQWTYTGYDASAHVAEETVRRPARIGMGRLHVGGRLGGRWLHLPRRHHPPPARPVPALWAARDMTTASQYYFGDGAAVLYTLSRTSRPRSEASSARASPSP